MIKYEVHGALESSLGFPGVSKLWFFLFASSSPQICTDCILIGANILPTLDLRTMAGPTNGHR